VRDYIHVTDLARAHVAALDRLQAGDENRCLNLGTGIGHSVREIVETVERISGRPVNTVELPRRAGDPAILVAAPDTASMVLDWQPQWSDLDTIVRTALAWHAGAGRSEYPAEARGERHVGTLC
jgi:UDP-glucose 4-epimerase